MKTVTTILIALVAVEHLYFLVLEMFLWTAPIGLKTFGLTPEFAQQSASLAANQGLYNGFLAAGLIWGAVKKENAFPIQAFFLSCVIVAGVFGAITVKTSILYVQALPALVAFGFAAITRSRGS